MVNILRRWASLYFAEEEAMVFLLLLLISGLCIWLFGAILTPVIAAVIIAYMLQGLVNLLTDRGAPHLLAVSLAVVFFIGISLALILVLMPLVWSQLTSFIGEVPRYSTELQSYAVAMSHDYPNILSSAQLDEWFGIAKGEIGQVGQLLLSLGVSSIPGVITILIYCVVVPMMVFFFLKDKDYFIGYLTSLLPKKRRMLTEVGEEMNEQIANYIRGKAIEILIVGGTTYIGFVFMGLQYSALLALVVGLSVLIPYVGAIVVTIPVAAVGLIQFGTGSEFITVMVIFLVIQGLDGNILVPLLFSEAVNLHPVVIIIAVIFFGGLWGFWGIFFAIPLATLIKAIMTAWPKVASHQDGVPEMID
ncbi:AI-2E family transporter [Litoribacillus peritrichatus]|uniref:AI-2E family transporter n=1 Tax=Litoribacillus peritrichatus TaxID=718191 RepID=A0ABP7N8E4_9GAMM